MNKPINAMLPATEALTITCNALATGPEATEILRNISEQIRTAAKAGKRSIVYPFDAVKRNVPQELRTAVRRMVEAAGYNWEHKDSQDRGSPLDRPIDTISW